MLSTFNLPLGRRMPSLKKCLFRSSAHLSFLAVVIESLFIGVKQEHFQTMHEKYGGASVAQSCPAVVTPWTAARRALLSLGFSRQEHWSGLPFPSPGDLPNPGIKPGSSALHLPTEL